MIKLQCPAKINLFLKVLDKRPDGYHNLESLFAFLSLHDIVEISKSDKFQLEISGKFADLIDLKNNIFLPILDYFSKEFQISKNLKINLIKNIPIGAGLGGGSSDAASLMKALNKIFSLNLDKKNLQKISLNFGSDIAFFFEDKASIVKGRGEIIENYNQNFGAIKTLLIYPNLHLSSKEIFTKFGNNFSQEISNDELQKIRVFDLINNIENDLTKAAISSDFIIDEVLIALKKEKAKIAKMSGSGSVCFGIFEDENQLEIAYSNLKEKFPEFFIERSEILMSFLN